MAYALTNSDNTLVTLVSLDKPLALIVSMGIITKLINPYKVLTLINLSIKSFSEFTGLHGDEII